VLSFLLLTCMLVADLMCCKSVSHDSHCESIMNTSKHALGQTHACSLPISIFLWFCSRKKSLAVNYLYKRRLKLLEAAKECRRRKKEYIKCLESRVAVLEVQNKKLIEELETLKDICSSKTD
uniref:BZIP domain-containing protein n=1 Tax=Apteryx owenii TaxID=8824 RepID=A0A8B9P193_APTOW